MKKRIIALMAAAVLMSASAMPAYATTKSISSPENVTVTPTPKTKPAAPTPKSQKATTNPRKSPKTGEIDYIMYGGLGAAAFASVAVFCKKRRDEEA